MFSKLKAGLQKAGKEMKGGFEKAGQNIKKGVEDANRNLNESRSHHASPEKKKSEIKSSKSATSAAEAKDKAKSEKSNANQTTTTTAATTATNATERKTDNASTPPAPATRASSVHSGHSTRASSVHGRDTPAEAPAAPRSRASTPVPPPPPPPPTKTPKRAGDKAAKEEAPTAHKVTFEEPPPAHSRTPSAESTAASVDALHFSDADDLGTPGSIHFSVESGSPLRKTASPQKPKAAAKAADPVPTAASAAAAEEEDLTTESSLDIQVEQDDDTDDLADHTANKAAVAAEKVTSAEVGDAGKEEKPSSKSKRAAATAKKDGDDAQMAKASKKAGKTGTQHEEAMEKDARKKAEKRTSSRTSSPAVHSSSTAATTKASAKGDGATKDAKATGRKKDTPLRSRASGRQDPDTKAAAAAAAGAKKPPSSSRSSKSEVHFAEDALERPSEKKQRKSAERRAKPVEPSDSDSGSGSEGSGPDADTRRQTAIRPTRHADKDNEDESDGEAHDGASHSKLLSAEEEKKPRRHRGFRLSPARDESDKDASSDEEHRPVTKDTKKGESFRSRKQQLDQQKKPSPTKENRESASRSRRRDAHSDERKTSSQHRRDVHSEPRRAARHRDVENDHYGYDGEEEEDEEEEVEYRPHRRRGSSERRERPSLAATTPAPTSPSPTTRHRGSSQRTPLRALDGGALVEECVRDTAGYARGPVRRRDSSRSRRGEPVQRRSAVQSTYQLDYPDWSQFSDPRRRAEHAVDDYDTYFTRNIYDRGGNDVERVARRSRSGSARASSAPRPGDRPSSRASSSFHRLSFYDADDALAAEAVAEPSRFSEHSARRHHRSRPRYEDADTFSAGADYGYGSGGEAAVPRQHSRSSSTVADAPRDADAGHARHRTYDVAGRGARDTASASVSSFGPPHEVPQPRYDSGRHVYDAPRPRSPPRTSSSYRRPHHPRVNSPHRAAVHDDVPRSESWHRLEEDRADPDYYFSDAPRDRQSNASWNSRARGSAFAPSPPRSPLWARRGSFGRAAVEVNPSLGRTQQRQSPAYRGGSFASLSASGAGLSALSPLRGRSVLSGRRYDNADATDVNRSRGSQSRPTSARSAARSEEELLEEVEWKLDVLGQQIVDEDHDRERAMLSSPFERLYHLNNRRDRDERRKKVFQLNRLERIRDRIVSGSLQEDIARREERLRKQEEMLTSPNGVFLRLYQNTSGVRSRKDETTVAALEESSRHSTPGQQTSTLNATGVSKTSSRPSSATRRTLNREERRAMCDRLYAGAAMEQRKKEEARKQTVEERRQREVEELLIARLVAQLQLDHARLRPKDKKPPQTLAELEAEAQRELEKLRQEDPTGYEEKLLRGRVLSAKEQGLMSNRLLKQGYVSKEQLAARKAREEVRNCTFQPEVNQYAGFAPSSAKNRGGRRGGGGGSEDDEDDERSGSEDERSSAADSEQPAHRKDGNGDRCKELYRKGMKAKAREAELRDEHDREARLKILRGRMASDHHFRRRVELDPSLAERFMKSLVV